MFLGLSATTVTLLQHEGVRTGWVAPLRFTLLTLAVLWSLRLAARVLGQRPGGALRHVLSWLLVGAGLVPFCLAWWLFFVAW